jgi:catechol 2,3-dioxygenase
MSTTPLRLQLSHSTIAARDLARMVAFYTEVLGFLVTNEGEPMPGMGRMAFLSQTPTEHHQIVLVETAEPAPPAFMFADHLAFRVGSLDDLRVLADRLLADGNTSAIPIDHGNAWSLYFTDPEGNGLECFIDTPFHVAQPYGDALDLSLSDGEIEEATRTKASAHAEFQPFTTWREHFAGRLREREG